MARRGRLGRDLRRRPGHAREPGVRHARATGRHAAAPERHRRPASAGRHRAPGDGTRHASGRTAAGHDPHGDPTAAAQPSVTPRATAAPHRSDCRDPTAQSRRPRDHVRLDDPTRATDPTTNPHDEPDRPTAHGPGDDPITFTSTPPIDPAFGTRTSCSASGGSGKGIVFSIDPATTHRACSLDNAGTTVTFDHAGTCVIAAHATTRSAARALAGRGVAALGASARAAAVDAKQTVQVPKGRQHLDFQLGTDARVGGRISLSATRGASGQPVTFEVDNPDVCSINAAGTAVTFQHASRARSPRTRTATTTTTRTRPQPDGRRRPG